jgi:hypothetical protein
MGLILEGTWEEIKLHEAELAGKHIRVTVEAESANKPEPTDEEREADKQRRLDAWARFGELAKSDVIIDDSREGIYGPDGWRG